MNRFFLKIFFGAALLAASAVSQGAALEVERIVAVVNSEVITQSQLRDRLTRVRQNLQKQGEPMPPPEELERQVLEQLVMERVQMQEAGKTSLRVDDGMIDRAIQLIANNNNMTLDQLRNAVARDGISWKNFREEVRIELTLTRLRETEVDSKITISDAEVDNFLRNHPEALSGAQYRVAHILLRVPENLDEAQMGALRARAEKVMSRLQSGEDFAKVAANSSDAPDKARGGDLGWLSRDRLPGFYGEVVGQLKVGEFSPPLRSAVGLHIIKLMDMREEDTSAAQAVEQTHARHILLKTSELLSDTEAQSRLQGLRERVINGADFGELAKASSADLSAGRGGDLGWLNPGDTVPDFERAMNALAPNQVSEPVRSPFGWHLIQVLERRKQDMREEIRRNAARNMLMQRRSEEAFDDWLRQLRDSAYVEYKLENVDE